MAIWYALPRGATTRAAAVMFFLLMSVARASAAPDGGAMPVPSPTPADEKVRAPNPSGQRGPSFSFDSQDLTGKNQLPFSTGSGDDLAQWKEFNPAGMPTEEGSVIYQDPMAGLRAAAPPPPEVTPWQTWLLPGALAFGAALLIAAGLAFWRLTIARRAAAELASRYMPPVRK